MSSSRPSGGRRFPLPLAQLPQAHHAAQPRADVQRPQRLVQAAVADAARRRPPVGLGLDSAVVRAHMVARLRSAARIDDERVLAAFAAVERHRFVDAAFVTQAYEDTSLPSGHGQTISKPSVVAQILQWLLHEFALVRPAAPGLPCLPGRVLEIGTGCGYQAALLARLASSVVGIERLAPLAEKARANLAAAGVHNVQVLHADGRCGAASLAPFDAIVSAAGGSEPPPQWLEQLAPGGRLVAPGVEVRPGVQPLIVVDRGPSGYTRRIVAEVYFVPLESGAQ